METVGATGLAAADGTQLSWVHGSTVNSHSVHEIQRFLECFPIILMDFYDFMMSRKTIKIVLAVGAALTCTCRTGMAEFVHTAYRW